jgi:hypothetical protein
LIANQEVRPNEWRFRGVTGAETYARPVRVLCGCSGARPSATVVAAKVEPLIFRTFTHGRAQCEPLGSRMAFKRSRCAQKSADGVLHAPGPASHRFVPAPATLAERKPAAPRPTPRESLGADVQPGNQTRDHDAVVSRVCSTPPSVARTTRGGSPLIGRSAPTHGADLLAS